MIRKLSAPARMGDHLTSGSLLVLFPMAYKSSSFPRTPTSPE
jgi:hypothetical protein